MKIGFLTQFDRATIDFAADNGFGSIQLMIPPGAPLDPVREGDDAIRRAKDYTDSRGIEISAVGCVVNCIQADRDAAEADIAYFSHMMDLTRSIGVDVIAGYPGRDPELSVEDNIPRYKAAFTPLAKKAEDIGLKIAFENCPKFHYFPFRGVNIAYSPRIWDMMFDAIPSDALGLEYDPSHPVSMLADPIAPIYRYGSKIFHVHAKDAEILRENLALNGIFEKGLFRYRIPGFGDVDWKRFISALVEVGYTGNLDIEGSHDVLFSKEREQDGLVLGKRHLEQFVPMPDTVKRPQAAAAASSSSEKRVRAVRS